MKLFVRSCLIALLLLPPAVAGAQQPAPVVGPEVTMSSESARYLETGQEFERKSDWISAIQTYEQGLRLFPDHAEISRRLLIVRLHYDVVRRSNDNAIIKMIDRISLQDALDLYSEVLARLETSYVDRLRMHDLVRSGTAYLEVALSEPGFLDLYLAGQSPESIRHFRAEIHKVTLSRPAKNRQDVRQTVLAAAQAAEKSLRIKPAATVMQFVFGAVSLLDPYSSFLSSTELDEVESQIEGNFVGLGVALQPHEVPLRILNVIPGGPAREAGLKAGDRIVQIDSTRCEDVGSERAADLLRGAANSRVALTIQNREGGEYVRHITRRRVEVPSVEDVKIVDPANGAGYLRISSFQKTTAAELDKALWSLHRDGMQSLIIDLRGNPGGWLDASVAAADRFISNGGIVSTRGKNGIENQNYNATPGGTWQVPLVVLIDGQSASASEIFAGAIRDNRRGELVGETTYGKGSVQGLFHTRSLSSGIRLTVSKFYSPNGRAISLRGVLPTIAVGSKDNPQFVSTDSEAHVVGKVPVSDNGSEADLRDRPLQIAIRTAQQRRFAARSPAE